MASACRNRSRTIIVQVLVVLLVSALALNASGVAVAGKGDSAAAKWHVRLDQHFIDACDAGSFDMVRSAVDAGGDLNCRMGGNGDTPLQLCVRRLWNSDEDRYRSQVYAMAELLLNRGADPNLPDILGDYVISDSLITAAKSSVSAPNFRLTDLLLAHGADINMRNNATGETLLMRTVIWDIPKAVPYLVAHGAKINDRDRKGNTALVLACCFETSERGDHSCHPDVAAALIAHGADVNLKNADGESPLLRATEADPSQESGVIKIATLLVNKGAQLDCRDHRGLTAEQLAHRYGLKRLTAYLRAARLAQHPKM